MDDITKVQSWKLLDEMDKNDIFRERILERIMIDTHAEKSCVKFTGSSLLIFTI